jgi:hypothetical protein
MVFGMGPGNKKEFVGNKIKLYCEQDYCDINYVNVVGK